MSLGLSCHSCHSCVVLYDTNHRSIAMPKTPTKRAYDDLDAAYEYFNKQLFVSRVPPCLITVRPQTPQVGDSCQEWLRTLRRSGNGQGAQEREEAGTYGSGPYRRARLGTAP